AKTIGLSSAGAIVSFVTSPEAISMSLAAGAGVGSGGVSLRVKKTTSPTTARQRIRTIVVLKFIGRNQSRREKYMAIPAARANAGNPAQRNTRQVVSAPSFISAIR